MYTTEDIDRDFEKAQRVITLCKTPEQLKVAWNWVLLFNNKCSNYYIYSDSYFKFLNKLMDEKENELNGY